ncbi:Hypothetical_protein [Hexamita inflata]|uniref:Hypothetical_protein n=1 Tax=Hexamita inflata TaxID=28002 RepID=A0AA86US52_9EUKA|nr:Hypothetical protein HINF_LOCUS53549 [Hexamita inflata]
MNPDQNGIQSAPSVSNISSMSKTTSVDFTDTIQMKITQIIKIFAIYPFCKEIIINVQYLIGVYLAYYFCGQQGAATTLITFIILQFMQFIINAPMNSVIPMLQAKFLAEQTKAGKKLYEHTLVISIIFGLVIFILMMIFASSIETSITTTFNLVNKNYISLMLKCYPLIYAFYTPLLAMIQLWEVELLFLVYYVSNYILKYFATSNADDKFQQIISSWRLFMNYSLTQEGQKYDFDRIRPQSTIQSRYLIFQKGKIEITTCNKGRQ